MVGRLSLTHGQHTVMIYINYDRPPSPMLHTTYVEIGLPVLKKIFEDVLPYPGVAAILFMCPGLFVKDFSDCKSALHKIWL